MGSSPPNVSIEFLHNAILKSGHLQGQITAGKSTSYIKKGTSPQFKRITILRKTSTGEVGFDTAMGAAIRFKFITELLDWLKTHKKWNEGGFDLKC